MYIVMQENLLVQSISGVQTLASPIHVAFSEPTKSAHVTAYGSYGVDSNAPMAHVWAQVGPAYFSSHTGAGDWSVSFDLDYAQCVEALDTKAWLGAITLENDPWISLDRLEIHTVKCGVCEGPGGGPMVPVDAPGSGILFIAGMAALLLGARLNRAAGA